MKLLRQIFCFHFWTDQSPWTMYEDPRWLRVGSKDYRAGAWFGCLKCGKVKEFDFNFIPLNPVEPK